MDIRGSDVVMIIRIAGHLQAGAVCVMDGVVLNESILDITFQSNARTGPVIRDLAGVINLIVAHGDVFEGILLAAVGRVQSDALARRVMNDRIYDLDVVHFSAGAAKIAD